MQGNAQPGTEQGKSKEKMEQASLRGEFRQRRRREDLREKTVAA
jgi:hypothetical protein